MQFISSDTNVWIDFVTIQKTEIPFRLPYTYIMSCDAVNEELLSPPGLGQQLTSYGLVPVEMTGEEFFLAEEYGYNYKKLSVHDRVALAIAKSRKIKLLNRRRRSQKSSAMRGSAIHGNPGHFGSIMGAATDSC